MNTMPGVNIQYPISRLILSGEKTVETRTYPLPSDYVGRKLALIETPGPEGDFKARVIAIIQFETSFKYRTKKEFYADIERHCVDTSSPWAWSDKPKWGWPVKVIRILRKPINLEKRQGIRFTKEVFLRGLEL